MIRRATPTIALLLLTACATGSPEPRDARSDIAATLDDFHAAAAEADTARYLGHFTHDGVFFGTDATERWTVEQFRPYVRGAFSRGGWTYVPRDRTVFLAPGGGTAWFDEMLDGATGVTARGTGVLVWTDGAWKVAQYNFSVPFPNALWDTINAMIRAEAE